MLAIDSQTTEPNKLTYLFMKHMGILELTYGNIKNHIVIGYNLKIFLN